MSRPNQYLDAIVTPRQYPDVKEIPSGQWPMLAEDIISRAKNILDESNRRGGMYPNSYMFYLKNLSTQAELVTQGAPVDGLLEIIEKKPKE